MTETREVTTFNFRDFILPENSIEAVEETKKAAAIRQKPLIEYTVEWSDHCDAIIKRKTKKTEQYLVLLVSKGQFYIKDSTGRVSELTEENYLKFMSDTDENGIKVNNGCIDRLLKGKRENENFFRVFTSKPFGLLARNDLVKMPSSISCQRDYYSANDYAEYMTSENLKLFKKVISIGEKIFDADHEAVKNAIFEMIWKSNSSSIVNLFGEIYFNGCINCIRYYDGATDYRFTPNQPAFLWVKQFFGESGASQFAEALAEQYQWNAEETRGRSRYYRRNYVASADDLACLMHACTYKFESWLNYLVYQPAVQGYEFDNFIHTWLDTLRMQKALYGEAVDKYPESLAAVHQKLSYRMAIKQKALDSMEEVRKNADIGYRAELLRACAERYKTDDYFIRSPLGIQDILDEAQAQANCLAGYVDAIASGNTDVYFMRSTENPDEALVDIEIRGNVLRQAYAHHNTRPTPAQMQFIEEWCNRNGFAFGTRYAPRAA